MRLLPPFVLLVLSPFVGEFLLGNIEPVPSSWLASLLPLVLLYGGGALVIREVTRRLGRGYPTMALFAVGYALLEEGIVLGTLFNRGYLDLGLLEYGWLPALGTSPVWSGYVLTIHTVWSILVPIVLTEHLFRARAHRPWLPVPGTITVLVAYLLGAAVVGVGNYFTYQFLPSGGQIVAVLVLVGGCIAIGLVLHPAVRRGLPGEIPSPRSTAVLAAVASSLFVFTQDPVGLGWSVPPAITLAAMVLTAGAGAAGVALASRRAAWTARHTLAAATGALVTYVWSGFFVQFSIHGYTTPGLVAQLVFVGIAVALLLGAWRQQRTSG